MSEKPTPEEIVGSHRIVVCVGTGGVGKTTVSAAFGMLAARRGLRTLVLTIDPARRLADALGIETLGNEPKRVRLPADALEAHGDIELHAMMLDPKGTFDGLIERFSPNEDIQRQILDNPIYQHASGALSGSGEYAAMEKVLEMSESGDFDLVVVDTPPAQHVLEFLDAPRRLVEFLDSRLVKLLVHPAMAAGRWSVRMFQRPVQGALQLLERVTGVGFLEDLSSFLLAIDDLSDGFKSRAARIESTLLGPQTAFVLVAGPSREATRNAGVFLDHLEDMRARLRGVVINRIRQWPGEEPAADALLRDEIPGAERRQLADALGDANAADAVIDAVRDFACVANQDTRNVEPLTRYAETNRCFFRRVPEQRRDVHDLDTLDQITAALAHSEEKLASP
ncbi:MAG: ArsA-related P-loop ATPase [Myxococcota bacterium]|nr:ArsA-related P-loop ATPase [Myxococcota bacterium]